MRRSSIRIMILDDEEIVCERIKALLEKDGHTVEAYTRSEDALSRLAEQRFQVLLADLKMSGPKGLDVIRFAREHYPAIKPVVITGFATSEMAREAFDAGAVEFIAKPFRQAQIRQLIARLASEFHPEP
jgi:DNA-binding NtrC family response regulator